MVLQGVIDSPDIPLNVSRSYLQMDRTVRQLSGHISKKVSDSLANLYRNQHEKYLDCWTDISPVIKLGAIEDSKFYERVKELLIWKIVEGGWTTIEQYLERNGDKTKERVLYTKDEKQLSHFLDIYKKKNIEVICAHSPLDTYTLQFLETKIAPAKIKRIDSEIDENILDKEREKSILDAEGRTEASRLAEFVRSKLSDENLEVEAKSLASDEVPGFIVIDEDQRRMRDYLMSLSSKEAPAQMGQMTKKTFIVNTNNPLISAIKKLDKTNADLAGEVIKEVYDLSLLSQREMDPNALNDFINRSTSVLENLAKEALKNKKENETTV
jgi:molecular chaperone HtpG